MTSVNIIRADQFSIFEENDVFYKTDHYYTNGTRFQYLRNDDIGFAIGQNMYSPADLEKKELIPDDRPYAGYLYGSVFNTTYYKNNTELFLEGELGFTGKDSYAEKTQEFIHKHIDSTMPQGWKNQIHSHLTGEVISKYITHLLSSKYFSVDPYIGAEAGNLMDYVDAGFNVYLGYDLPEKRNTTRVIPLKVERGNNKSFGFYTYVYGGLEPRLVFHNMLLDDNRFNYSIENYVYNENAGYVIGCRYFELAFTYCHESKEFSTQQQLDSIGSIKLSFNF